MSGTFGLRCFAMRVASDFSSSANIIFCCVASASLSLSVLAPAFEQRFRKLGSTGRGKLSCSESVWAS